MPRVPAHLRTSAGWLFDMAVCCVGLTLFAVTLAGVHPDGLSFSLPVLLGVPLIVVVARFPMVVDNRDGGIEVGFDSSILMFLLCTLDPEVALFVWSLGVLVTQLTTSKRWTSKAFNIGVGITAGAVAEGVLLLARGDGTGTPRELVAVMLAAVAYFATDYVTSAVSVAIDSGTGVRRHLLQRGTLLAVACFVPFDTLGYLAAVVHRSEPAWTLILLAVPLVTLLIATRAVTRGRENARRLTVLFAAAVRAQTLPDREAVLEALIDDSRELLHLKRVALRSTPPNRFEIGAEVHDGDATHWLVARAMERARSTIAADEEALKALAAVASDAFARLALTEETVHLARHDPLTDLPNRGILLDRLTHAQTLARRHGSRVALLFIDLDGFKPVNDRYGHAAGDAVLVGLASRLQSCVREADTVARLGGDEFAVLFEDADAVVVELVWERILSALEQGVAVTGQLLRLSASAGIAWGGADDDAEALLRKADLAMYEAKARGKGAVVVYEDSIGRSRLDRLIMADDLRRAVANREIEVAYQPIVATSTGRIVGAEALARWRHNGSPVSPELFIGIAEDSGLIVELGEVILSKVAADAAALRALAGSSVGIAVNISAGQLRSPGFVDSVAATVKAMGGSELTLEITERQGIDLDTVLLERMREISAMGVRFAIDDFGVGFSSISYLADLPVHVIKVDASLSQFIDADERSKALLRSVTLIGQSLGLEVVVEGIERQTQLDVLREHTDAQYVQGYLLYRPMPLPGLLAAVRDDRVAAGLAPVS